MRSPKGYPHSRTSRYLYQKLEVRSKKFTVILLCLFLIFSLVFPQAALAEKVTQKQLQKIEQQWQTSAHALAEVNCSSCHQEQETKKFVAKPTEESCRSCHETSVDTFLLGKHGIRTLEGLSPLTPAMAHLPMQAEIEDKQMNCNTCHNVHTVNTYQASVDSCLTCHADNHSLNYKNSPHASIFQEIGTLPRPSRDSVTCATCHLPREASEDNVLVNHNNTYTLKPRDRMVKEVCMNCHGVEHSYDSIFDDELVEANFARPPNQKLPTFQLVRDLEKKRSSKGN
ncbi:MAG: cytochrome c3 family protein [Cyanobacteria bacterium P01_G01_bin.19]